MFSRASLPYAFLFAAISLHADVTIRQAMEFQMKVPTTQKMPAPFNAPTETVSRIKGDRAYSSFGSIVSISDSAKNQVTLLDAQGKRYATASLADYLAELQKSTNAAAMPEQARQMLANLKVDIQSNDTGRSERILGIDAAEREITFHMTIPIPLPGQENGLEVTGKFQCWKPKPGEAQRVPALRELLAYHARAGELADSGNILKRMFGSWPGLGDNMQKLTDELSKGGGANLRMRGAFYMPGLAAMMARAKDAYAQAGAQPPSPDSPLVEMRLEVTAIDTDPVPDSVFTIPPDYQQASLEDLVKVMMPAAAKQ